MAIASFTAEAVVEGDSLKQSRLARTIFSDDEDYELLDSKLAQGGDGWHVEGIIRPIADSLGQEIYSLQKRWG
jgi:hypothetical protein